ncbi:hypothetical protein [Sphingomonas paeninsulae]|uniref:hypothetical protein n=1 Tax=Sphingomonas paeninsulae TaxID=2319844 RepID=UPI0013CE77F5
MSKVNFIGQRYASSASTAITKVPRDPNSFGLCIENGFEHARQIVSALRGRIWAIMEATMFCPWIEHRRRAKFRKP